MFSIRFTIFCSCLFFFPARTLYALDGTNPTNAHANVYTYPSLLRHEQRFWNNTRFLYEKNQTKKGLGNLACIEDAVRTLPYSMPFYNYYVGADTKIITNIENISNNIGVVIFSHSLMTEASLLPSEGKTSPILFLSSLIKIMCPKATLRTGYAKDDLKMKYDYLIFEYTKD